MYNIIMVSTLKFNGITMICKYVFPAPKIIDKITTYYYTYHKKDTLEKRRNVSKILRHLYCCDIDVGLHNAYWSSIMLITFNPYPAKFIYLNFYQLEVVSRYRHPQLQVCKKYSYMFNLGSNICKS